MKPQSGYLIHRGASVVVPMPSVGMVYLEVRRAASETIRAALNLFFGANWSTCGPQSCGGRTPFDRRCNSFCLPTFARSLGRPLFTFSFVRHPVERYYSGLEVYLMRHPSSTLSVCAAQPPGECNLTRKIHTLLTTAAGPPSNLTTHPSSGDESSAGGEQPLACLTSGIARDAHMYSQAAQLNVVTGETPRNSSRNSSQHLQLLPIYSPYITLETWPTSQTNAFIEMLHVANRSTVTAAEGALAGFLDETQSTAVWQLRNYLNHTRKHGESQDSRLKVRIRGARSKELDRTVARAFAQDVACFFSAPRHRKSPWE